MPSTPTSLNARVSEALTVEKVLELIGIDLNRTVQLGDTIKCNCPSCGNAAFKTLFINTQHRTFGCRYTKCPAHHGGDFTALIALVRGVSESEVTRQLINELDLEVSSEEEMGLGEDLQKRGFAALSSGDFETARRLLEEVANSATNPIALDPDLLGKLSHCCWELGDHDAARRWSTHAIDHLEKSGDIHTAILMVSDLIHMDSEWAPALYLRLGKMLVEEGDVERAHGHFLTAADGLQRQGEQALAAEALEAAVALQPEDTETRKFLFRQYLSTKQWEECQRQLSDHLALCREQGLDEEALQTLRCLEDAGQLSPSQRLLLADMRMRMDERAIADRILCEVADAAGDDEDMAIEILGLLQSHELTAAKSGDLTNQEARILVQALITLREWDDLAALLDVLTAENGPADDQTIANAFEALGWAKPNNLTLRQRHLEWAAVRERSAEVLPKCQSLLSIAADQSDTEAAHTAWKWICELAPEDYALRCDALATLWRVDSGDEIRIAWAEAISGAFDSKRLDVARSSGHAFLSSVGFDADVADLVLTAAHQQGELDAERESAEALIAHHINVKNWDEAESNLRRLIDVLDAEETEGLWKKLADVLQASGRPDAASSLFLARAEQALSSGHETEAEQHLAVARDCAEDRWTHWRSEWALAHRVNAESLAERLFTEALDEASQSDRGAIDALVSEFESGHHSVSQMARLIATLCDEAEDKRAEALFEKQIAVFMGADAESQTALVGLIETLPQCTSVWTRAISNTRDGNLIAKVQGQLSMLAATEEIETSQRLDLLRQAIQRWPECPQAFEAMAACLEAAGQKDEAASTLDKLADLHLKLGNAAEAVAVCKRLESIAAPSFKRRARLAQAMEKSDDKPGATALWLEIASQEIDGEADSESARQAIDNARRLGGETPELLEVELKYFEQAMDEEAASERALALARQSESEGDTEAALDLLSHCVEKFGESRGLLRAQAETLARARQPKAAARVWRTLLDRHWEQSEWTECEDILDELQTLTPDVIEDAERRVEICWHRGKTEEWHEHLNALCDRCLGEGRWTQAADLLRRAVTKVEDPRVPLKRLATILQSHQEIDEALATLRRVIDISLERDELAEAESHMETMTKWAPSNVAERIAVLERMTEHWPAERGIQAHAEMTETLRRMGNLDEALQVCQRGLTHWPEHEDLLATLAEIHLSSGRESAAAECLRTLAERLVQVGDEDESIQVRRRILSLSAATLADRWALLEAQVKAGKRTDALEHLQWLADHHQAKGERSELRRAHTRVLEIEPTHPGALAAMATLCAETGDLEEAIKRWLSLAQVHLQHSRRAPAEQAFGQILEHDPGCVAALEGLFRIHEQKENPRRLIETAQRLLQIHADENWAEAEKLIAHIESAHPDANEVFLTWADILADRGRRSEGIAMLDARLVAQRKAERLNLALETLEHLTQMEPNRVDWVEQLAAIAMETGDKVRAKRAWERALAGHRARGDLNGEHTALTQLHALEACNVAVLHALGDAAINLGFTDEAVEHLQRIVDLQTEEGDLEAKVTTLQRIIRLDAEMTDCQRELGETLLVLHQHDKGLSALGRAFAAYRLHEDWEKAAATAARIVEINPTDAPTRQLQGEALIKAGRSDDAVEVLTNLATACQAEHDYLNAEIAWRSVLEVKPDALIAREQLAAILAAQDMTDEAVAIWQSVAETHRTAGDAARERKALVAITGLQPHNATAQRRLAALWLEVGEVDSAWQAYQHLLSAAQDAEDEEAWAELENEILGASGDPRLRIQLAALHLEANRKARAIELYREVAEVHQRAEAHTNVRATCQLILQIDPSNIGALEMMVNLAPKMKNATGPSPQMLRKRLGMALLNAGETKKALPVLEKLHRESPDCLETLAALLRLHQEMRDQKKFGKLLDTTIEIASNGTNPAPVLSVCQELMMTTPWPDVLRAKMGELALTSGLVAEHQDLLLAWARDLEKDDLMRATEICEAVVKAAPGETAPHRQFAEFLIKHGQHTRANIELMALADIYTSRGETAKMIHVLEQARQLDEDNPHILHRLGKGLMAQNARGRALELLKQAAHVARSTFDSDELCDLYQTILEIDPGEISARRELIDTLLAEQRTEEAIQQSFLLADQCAMRGFLDLAAQSCRTVVQLEPRNLDAWLRLLDAQEQLGNEHEHLADFLTVARLCLSVDKGEEAIRHFRHYLKYNPTDTTVRREKIEVLQERGDTQALVDECRTMIEICNQAGNEEEATMWQRKMERHTRPALPNSRRQQRPSAPAPEQKSRFTAAGASRHRIQQKHNETAPPQNETERLERALTQYMSHLELDPQNAKLHVQLAELMHHLRREEDAVKHWLRASELQFEQQNWESCVALCERLIQLLPTDGAVHDRLKKARLRHAQMSAIDNAIEEADS